MSATLLSIDTSSAFCSVALSHNSQINREHSMTEQSHSEHILPMVRRVLNQGGVSLIDVNAFVVGIGPGGFTGVRLGVAIVQGLAYATGKKVIPLSSLLALAQAAFELNHSANKVLVANDARMKQVYWAAYEFDSDGVCMTLHEPSLGDLTHIEQYTGSIDLSHFQLAGNAWSIFADFHTWQIEQRLTLSEADHSAPNAVNLLPAAQLGYSLQNAIDPHLVSPLYVRDKIAQTIVERAAATSQ